MYDRECQPSTKLEHALSCQWLDRVYTLCCIKLEGLIFVPPETVIAGLQWLGRMIRSCGLMNPRSFAVLLVLRFPEELAHATP